MSAILKVENLNVTLRHRRVSKKLVEDVSFEVHPGECLGILGESGSGKSMTVKSVLGLLDKNFQVSGSAIFDGQDLLKETKEELRRLRGSRITMVPHNPGRTGWRAYRRSRRRRQLRNFSHRKPDLRPPSSDRSRPPDCDPHVRRRRTAGRHKQRKISFSSVLYY